MPMSNAAPMVRRRTPATGYGEHLTDDHRSAKSADRIAWRHELAIDLADTHEVIAAHAITPLYADYADELYADDYVSPDEWADQWDAFADSLDDHPFGPPIGEDDIDLVGTPITDQDIPGGWGTGLAWEDLQTLTITNRPYLWSTGKEASR